MLRVLHTSLPRSVRFFHRSGVQRTPEAVAISDVAEGDEITLTTGSIARFASGSVVASQGDNAVLATCVFKKDSSQGNSFLPLTVDYRQSAAAVGKIPTNYLRREMSQSDPDILTSRIIDRSIRPMISPGWRNDTQIVLKPLCLDDGDGVTLAANAAAAALMLSPVPLIAPVATVRIGLVGDTVVINPTRETLRASRLNMVLSGSIERRTVMIEMDGQEIEPEVIEMAVDKGLDGVEKMLNAMDQLVLNAGKMKEQVDDVGFPEDIYAEIQSLCEERLFYVLTDSSLDKVDRDKAIQEIGKDVKTSMPNTDFALYRDMFADITKKQLRQLVLDGGLRCDGRTLTDFRPIHIKLDVYKRLHGSALFQRGQTQVMSTVTFDNPSAAFHPDSVAQLLGSQRRKMFMLHYEFPGFATNEISTGRGSNRREIGHGALAEKALQHLIPEDFAYSVRLACQVLESNGSSSMASVCGGSLALLDAGVPMKAPAAGVAIGLITDEEKRDENYKVLTDILGIEDYAGDMDFKIAGTRSGFTAMQLDVKIAGLSRKQLSESLQRGREGVNYVLDKMAVMRDRPRSELKSSVPVIEQMAIDAYNRQILYRGGAVHIKQIEAETGTKITREDDTHISLFSPNNECLQQAKEMVNRILNVGVQIEYSFGQMVSASITEVLERGVNVQLQGVGQQVFVPNSQLHTTPIQHASAIGLKTGDKMTVQYLGRDPNSGKIRLSRKTLQSSSLPTKGIRR